MTRLTQEEKKTNDLDDSDIDQDLHRIGDQRLSAGGILNRHHRESFRK